MPAVISAEQLTKSYGKSRGVVDLSFEVAPGEVFGYLGPNGAGKTTTIRTMLDFIRPTSGRITVFGLDPRSEGPAVHARTGYLPGEFGLYERLTGAEYLRTFAGLRGGVPWTTVTGLADRLKLDLAVEDPVAVARKQAQGRPDPGIHARAGPAGDGRADAGPRPAGPTGVLRAGGRGAADVAPRCSSSST